MKVVLLAAPAFAQHGHHGQHGSAAPASALLTAAQVARYVDARGYGGGGH